MLEVEIDAEEFRKSIGPWQNQFEYAMSQTINEVMKSAQKLMIQKVGENFTVRRQAFVNRSIKISQFAKKDNLNGVIGIENIGAKSTADILGKFEMGEEKKPVSSANIAIPTEFIKPQNSIKIVPVSQKPRNLTKGFKLTNKSGTNLIMQRTDKNTLNVAYILKSSVHINPRLQFITIVGDYIRDNFERVWQEKAQHAIDTSK